MGIRPSSAMQTKSPTRNTINQRASRARRKNYISELEQKVRDFEVQGVHATEQVQRAARRVADENRVLRDEVQALRARNAELEILIAERMAIANGHDHPRLRDPSEGIMPVGYPTTSRLEPKPQEQYYPSPPHVYEPQIQPQTSTSTGRTGTPGTNPAIEPPPHLYEISLHRQTSTSTGSKSTPETKPANDSPPKSTGVSILHASTTAADIEQHPVADGEPAPPAAGSAIASLRSYDGTILDEDDDDEHPTADPYATEGPTDPSSCCTGVNSTSCAQAAMIIASMRGLPPSDETLETEILPQLGCGTGDGCGTEISASPESQRGTRYTYQDALKCTVDNVRLFGILDQERTTSSHF